MKLARSAQLPMFVAAGVLAAAHATLGLWPQAAGFGAVAGCAALVGGAIHLIQKHNERKSNGRHRKASEAHRAGAGRSAGNRASAGARARGGAVRTGAGVSSIFGPHGTSRSLDSIVENMLRANLSPIPVARSSMPKARPAGEFDGKQADFAPGVVTGTRSFAVDKLGRLLGVAYAAVWTPGENTAKCMERGDYDFITLQPQGVHESGRDAHSMTECAHGFYGYYEGSNDYYESGRVMGVVEGYGETIIGSRGFRAAKARIVALHIPAEIPYGRRRLIARNYPGIPTFDSFDSMVAEFPPDDAGHGINPDTDPDFWTRKAAS